MEFTHFNEKGRARMVDVSEKNETQRRAIARGYIQMNPETIKMINEGKMKKEMFYLLLKWGGYVELKKLGI